MQIAERMLGLVLPNLGLPELVIIVLVALLIFGGRRLGDIGRGLGEGIRNFRSAVKDGDKPAAEGEKHPKASA
jgi:sec-independent protein translocase protein TatA